MKAIGIVRRLDDLGRIVIPNEIRSVMKLRENDPLEIFVGDDDSLIIKRYRPMEIQMKEAAAAMLNALSERGITDVAVYDRFGLIIHNCKKRKPDLSVPDAVKTHSVTPAISRLSVGENIWVRVLSEHGDILGYIIGDDCILNIYRFSINTNEEGISIRIGFGIDHSADSWQQEGF